MKNIFLIVLSVLFSSSQVPGSAQSYPILLQNGIIHTIKNGTIYGPDLLFNNGKIQQIGNGLEIPKLLTLKENIYILV